MQFDSCDYQLQPNVNYTLRIAPYPVTLAGSNYARTAANVGVNDLIDSDGIEANGGLEIQTNEQLYGGSSPGDDYSNDFGLEPPATSSAGSRVAASTSAT